MSRLQPGEAEGLTLLEADNKTGYFGVYTSNPSLPKPYAAQVYIVRRLFHRFSRLHEPESGVRRERGTGTSVLTRLTVSHPTCNDCFAKVVY